MTKATYVAQTITAKLETGETVYFIASESHQGLYYKVEHAAGHLTCTCPARKPCKHIRYISAKINQALKDERQPVEITADEWAAECDAAYEKHFAAETPASVVEQAMQAHDEQESCIVCGERTERTYDDEPLCYACWEVQEAGIQADQLRIKLMHEQHRLANLREQERMAQEYRAKREAAMIADHVPETFSIFKCSR